MADHMRASFVGDALTMALEQRRPGPLVFHSEWGRTRARCVPFGTYVSLARPPEPDVRLSPHPALHKSAPLNHDSTHVVLAQGEGMSAPR